MKFEVNVSKTRFFVLLGAVLLLAGALMVYAFSPIGSFSKNKAQAQVFGHSADEVVIRASDGSDYTLQEAINNGKLGGGSSTPDFDSGWINIPNGLTTFTHNLNTMDSLVYIEFNDTDGSSSGGVNSFFAGGELNDNEGNHNAGWIQKTSTTITIRKFDSSYSDNIRVLMWKLNKAPLIVSCSPNKNTVLRFPGPPALPLSQYQVIWSATVLGADPAYATYDWVDENGVLDSAHTNPRTRTYGTTGTVSYTLTVKSAGRTTTVNCGSVTVV